jgi:hypothetical protein
VPRWHGNDHLPYRHTTTGSPMNATSSPSRRSIRMHGPSHEPSLVMTPLSELALLPLIEDAVPEADGEFSRCGWFDSSLELAAGLQVTEFVGALPTDLPLQLA